MFCRLRLCAGIRDLVKQLIRPNLDVDGRKLTSIFMIASGITGLYYKHGSNLQFIDKRIYYHAAIFLGILILVTANSRWQRSILGRVSALLGSGLLISWGFDLAIGCTAFWALLILGFVLFRESIRR